MNLFSILITLISIIPQGDCNDSKTEKSPQSQMTFSSTNSIDHNQEKAAFEKYRSDILTILPTLKKSIRRTINNKNKKLAKLILQKRGIGESSQKAIIKEWAEACHAALKGRIMMAGKQMADAVGDRWDYGIRKAIPRNQFKLKEDKKRRLVGRRIGGQRDGLNFDVMES